ncbi:MAG: prephenate dehydrogenase [Chloroflexota bacterium]|nr:prephenate dehydrogenase [Chloroflexota bacterium]
MQAAHRVAILGTGLIGSSVGLAIKAARPQTQIVGYDASGDHLRRAQAVKAIDRRASLRDALADADLVIVSVPVGSMKALFEEMAPLLPVQALVMDTGSSKAQVLQWAETLLPDGVRFVGGHPMAGKTETGPDAADAKLFQGAVWCLAPLPSTQRDAIDDAVRLVESLGASPYFLDPDEHDGLVASVSHLPYLMSVALIGHLGRERSWRETASLAAGGFAYATHLSDSDPQMFADVMHSNRDNIARRLDLYIAELESLRNAIAADSPELKERFVRAQNLHQDWLVGRAQGQPGESENPLPTTRSMLTGSLFGRFGARDKEK